MKRVQQVEAHGALDFAWVMAAVLEALKTKHHCSCTLLVKNGDCFHEDGPAQDSLPVLNLLLLDSASKPRQLSSAPQVEMKWIHTPRKRLLFVENLKIGNLLLSSFDPHVLVSLGDYGCWANDQPSCCRTFNDEGMSSVFMHRETKMQ